MSYILIGLIVGVIMGLTGAGGAMVAIPLYVTLLNASLKEATSMSLLAVMAGSLINLNGKMSYVDKKTVLILSGTGILTGMFTLPLKSVFPDYVIIFLLISVAIFSVWNVWKPSEMNFRMGHGVLTEIFTGMILGALTTMTGLGGGVILLPILLKIYNKSLAEAIPTSLATIFLISLSSFAFQTKTVVNIISFQDNVLLIIGILSASLLLKLLLKKMTKTMADKLRKVVFTIVTIYSSVSIIM